MRKIVTAWVAAVAILGATYRLRATKLSQNAPYVVAARIRLARSRSSSWRGICWPAVVRPKAASIEARCGSLDGTVR
jgi:hypothetical protein